MIKIAIENVEDHAGLILNVWMSSEMNARTEISIHNAYSVFMLNLVFTHSAISRTVAFF